MNFFALGFDASGKSRPICYGFEPDHLPPDQIACTKSQFESPDNWVVSGGALVPATNAAMLLAAKSLQIERVNMQAQSALAQIVAAYPPLEVATWPNQLAEAEAYTADSAAPTPTLTASAAAQGITVAALAAKVAAKSAAYTAASGSIIGKRGALVTTIKAAATVEAVQSVNW